MGCCKKCMKKGRQRPRSHHWKLEMPLNGGHTGRIKLYIPVHVYDKDAGERSRVAGQGNCEGRGRKKWLMLEVLAMYLAYFFSLPWPMLTLCHTVTNKLHKTKLKSFCKLM
jgi:hypothetical protein